jgi:hypothetical protein
MKQLSISILLVFILSFFGIAAVALAQSQDGATEQPPEVEVPQLPEPTSNVEKKPDSPETYDINYLYDPGTRRDPFISLLTGIKKPSNVPSGQLTVADAKVVGITRNKEGYVAIIMGSDKKARFAKPGFKLYDGEVIAIEADRVIFRQDLTEDTLAAPGLKSKEVVKRLHPVQEGT